MLSGRIWSNGVRDTIYTSLTRLYYLCMKDISVIFEFLTNADIEFQMLFTKREKNIYTIN